MIVLFLVLCIYLFFVFKNFKKIKAFFKRPSISEKAQIVIGVILLIISVECILIFF